MRYTQLALTVIEGTRPDAGAVARAAAGAAQRELSAFVTDVACRVHHRLNYLRPQRAEDFVNEIAGHMAVVLLGKFPAFHAALAADANRSDDPAAGFLYTAVTNYYVSLARRKSPVQLSDANPGSGTGEGGGMTSPFDRMTDDNRRPATIASAERVDDADFWSAPLPTVDLRTIDGWRPIDAVVLLLLSGLHTKLTPAAWRGYLDRCGVPGAVPSAATLELPPGKRRDGLAVDLGLSRNGLDQIWSRKRVWLGDLAFVRRVRRDHPGRDAA